VRGNVPSNLLSPGTLLIGPRNDFCAMQHFPSATTRLWDLSTRKPRAEWPLDMRESSALALSPDGHLLARVTHNYVVALHETEKGQQVRSLDGPKWNVNAMTFSPDGRLVVAGSWDSQIYVWDVRSGRPACPPLRGHRRGVQSLWFSPEGRTLISASDDQ